MELDMQMQKFSCYQAANRALTEVQEESTENIIPDYCPDIARIIDTTACLFVRKYERVDDRIIVHGTTRINVLYMADSGGVKCFEFSLPLEKTLDYRMDNSCTAFSLSAVIGDLEVRTLNPRKLLTRIAVTFTINTYSSKDFSLCTTIPELEKYGIQTLHEQKTLTYIKSLCKHDFVFSEEIVLSAAKEPIQEILRCRESLRLEESKVLGSKVMLKGTVVAEILYLSEKGSIQQITAELPFSQILDGCADDFGQLSAQTDLWLSGAECYTTGEEGKVISVKLFIGAFVAIFESREIDCICDLYSISHRLEPTLAEIELSAQSSVMPHEISIKESLEIGTEVTAILAVEVLAGNMSTITEEKKTTLHLSCTVKLLYISDNGVPYCAQRRCEVNSELPAGFSLRTTSLQAKKITAIPTGNGVDVRFLLSGVLESLEKNTGNYLASLQVFEVDPVEKKDPSLVLRRMQSGESLWSISKAYCTTADEILSANECSDEGQLRAGKMLLIPKKR